MNFKICMRFIKVQSLQYNKNTFLIGKTNEVYLSMLWLLLEAFLRMEIKLGMHSFPQKMDPLLLISLAADYGL